jgi:hypothetical protein
VKTSLTPLIPVDQSVVTIAGHEIPAVRLSDGNVGAPLRAFCEMLHLDYSTQVQKVRTHPAIYDKLVLVLLKTSGGSQEANIIIAEAIPIWLTSMHISRVAPQSRELLRICQRDAARTIRSKFFPEVQGQQQSIPPRPKPSTPQQQQSTPKQEPKQSPPPRSAPQPAPLPPPDVPSMSVYDMLRAVINRMEQEHRETEARQARIDREHHEDVAWKAEMHHQMQLQREQTEVLWSVILGSASANEGALSADHLQMLELMMSYHQKVTGQPRAAIQRELLATVGVAELRHLQETDWKQIVGWFRQRLQQ